MTTTTRVPPAGRAALPFCAARGARRGAARTAAQTSWTAVPAPRSFLTISTRPQNATTTFGTHIASHANQ